MGALKQMTVSRCESVEMNEMEISTTQLVGDIVKIEEGLNVPADYVYEAWQCKVDESALTGESMPTKVNEDILAPNATQIEKYAYMGTTILQEGLGIVTATGMYTELGDCKRYCASRNTKNTSSTNLVSWKIPWLHSVSCCNFDYIH